MSERTWGFKSPLAHRIFIYQALIGCSYRLGLPGLAGSSGFFAQGRFGLETLATTH